jgi:hypothetical protein
MEDLIRQMIPVAPPEPQAHAWRLSLVASG